MGARLDQLIAAGGLALLVSLPARAGPSTGLPDLLQPGSRAASGLGTDAFRSPLDDACGWWADLAPQGEAWIRAEAAASVPLSRGATDDHGTLSGSELSWTAARQATVLRRRLLLAGRLVNPRWEGAWQGASTGVQLRTASTRFDVGLRALDVVPGLTLQLGAPLWRSRDDVHGGTTHVGLRWRAGSRLAVQGSWGESRLRQPLDTNLKGTPWSASLNVVAVERQLDARVALPLRLQVEGRLRRDDFDEADPPTAAPVYHISPAGHATLQQLGLAWNAAGRHGLLGRWTVADLETEGSLSWGGQRFGELSYGRGRLRSGLVAAQLPLGGARALLEFERVHLEGSARGALETWPFTPTVIDLLGSRRIARAQVAARWNRVQVGVEAPVRSGFVLRGGVGGYDVFPEARLESWRPVFLVFGRTDLRRDVLSVERLQLVSVTLGGELQRGRFRLSLGVQQFLPVRVARRDATAPAGAGGGTGDGGEPSSPVSWRDWPGGTAAMLSVIRAL